MTATPPIVPAGAIPTAPATAPTTAVLGEIVNPPAMLLARLTQTLTLDATVTGQTPDGLLHVRTRLGELTIRMTMPPASRQVVLQIAVQPAQASAMPAAPSSPPPGPTPLQVVVLVPDPRAAAGRATNPGAAAPTAGRPPAASVAPAPADPGAQGRASPNPQPLAALPGAAPLSAQMLGQRVFSAAAAARSETPIGNPAGAPASPNAGPNGPAAALQTTGPGPDPARPSSFSKPPAGAAPAMPPDIPSAGIAPRAAAALLGAVGQPEAASSPGAPTPAAPDPVALPALREALTALAKLHPRLAQQAAQAILPQPNGQLAATMLFFIGAARSGDARAWLGERAARALDSAGRGELVAKVAAELVQFSEPPVDQAVTDWRSYTIPLFHNGELLPVHLWTRREPGSEDESDPQETARRFVIEVELSRLGPLQLDGRMRQRRFDLVLRSHRALPPTLRETVAATFGTACEATGLAGMLVFQTGARDWIALARRGGSAPA